MIFLTSFVAMMAYVFLKSWQQRNVAFMHYRWVMPTSLLMAGCNVYIISKIAQVGWDFGIVIALGTGAGLGSMTAMYLHKRYVK